MDTGTLHLPRRNMDSLIAAAAGYFIIYLYTKHSGIGISPDSVTYLSVAQHIHQHGIFADFNGKIMVDFPLFYPGWLSIFIFLTGLEPLVFAPVMNGLLFAAVIYISGRMMESFIYPSKWYKWAILSFLVFSPCLLEIYSMLWSETLFLLLLLLFMIALRKYFLTHQLNALILAATLTAFACITRYAGITMVVTGLILVLLDLKTPIRKRIFHSLLFGLIAVSLLGANLVHNIMARGTLTGPREAGITPLFANIRYFGSVLCDWLPFFGERLAVLTALVVIPVLIFVFWRRNRLRAHLYTYEHIATTFFMVYALFILIIATVSRFEQLNSRLLSPLFIPLLWSGTYRIPYGIKKFSGPRRITVISACVLFVIAFQVNQLMADYEDYDGIKDAGVPGYTEDDWQYSPTVDFLKKNKPLLLHTGAVYSDADDAIWFFTALQTKLLPHKDNPQQLKKFFDTEDLIIVWFDDAADPDLISLKAIEARKKIKRLYKFDDGAIYAADSLSTPKK